MELAYRTVGNVALALELADLASGMNKEQTELGQPTHCLKKNQEP